MSANNRVVVTGMGLLTSLGLNEKTIWSKMMAGQSGIRPITAFDASAFKTPYGGEVDTPSLTAALATRKLRPLDRNVDMAMLVAADALEQAGILTPGAAPDHPTPMATLVGTGLGSPQAMFSTFTSYFEKGIKGIRPTSAPRCMANSISSQISLAFRLTGPNYVTISACTSSTTSIGIAYRLIKDGYIRQALCVGADAIFEPYTYGGWNNLGVMSRNPDPEKACRPFDAARDGCVLGEGAAALVLESLDVARQRGVPFRAEICGFGESSDAEHMTRPSPQGQALAIQAAIASAHITPTEIGFINAHGTATRANDESEAQSIRLAFGSTADQIPVASNKSFFGHLLGACGAAETVVTILGLENGRVPPNLNLDNPDPACNLMLVGKESMAIRSPVAMKNSFGFGGNNAVLILRRWNE